METIMTLERMLLHAAIVCFLMALSGYKKVSSLPCKPSNSSVLITHALQEEGNAKSKDFLIISSRFFRHTPQSLWRRGRDTSAIPDEGRQGRRKEGPATPRPQSWSLRSSVGRETDVTNSESRGIDAPAGRW